MADSQNPQSPNFKPGVGHLVTDRYDFQHHVEGSDFRHQAGSIDLNPSVMIGSTTITDVQTAIAALAGTIIVPLVPDATLTSKGIIQLAGDLGYSTSTAGVPRIGSLQGGTLAITGPVANQVLQWNGSAWVNATLVPATTSTAGTVQLAGDLGGFGTTATSPKVGALQGFTVSTATPSTGQALVWNGTSWTPTGIPFSPTGTGFATLTSGTYDATATPNIRYSSGKFQTDVNIQFKSGLITGDLSWTPTSIAKTLTLPDATDTLVAQNTTDTLTNKTINATNNTITDTSTATGDILAVISGSKFTRLAQGSNGTFLGVSSGVLGYYSPSIGVPTGTGFATVTGGIFDAAATANIRYTGGKFQSDTSIQFKSGGLTGDLSWTVTGINKTLLLPDISDTLVSQSSSDGLSNKTINATNNTITDTSIALGDLMKSSGSKFVRFAKGSALQVLRTNSGGTDLEWATVSFPATNVRIDQSGAGQLNNIATTDGSSNPAAIIRFTGDGAGTAITLTGLAAPASPSTAIQRITLVAQSTSKIIVSHQDTHSSSNNRIICPNGNNWLVQAATSLSTSDGYSLDVIWDNADLKWRVVAGTVQY